VGSLPDTISAAKRDRLQVVSCSRTDTARKPLTDELIATIRNRLAVYVCEALPQIVVIADDRYSWILNVGSILNILE
jgi:hypothetical protein